MKTLLAAMLLVSLTAQVKAEMSADQMVAYANNAILNAAEHGYKKVTLALPHSDPQAVEALADELRSRGYRLDEQARVLNEGVIKVLGLKRSAMAKAEVR